MAKKSNKITIYLWEEQFMTLSSWAKKHNLNPSSLRNTIYGIKPIRKVVEKIKIEDEKLFDLLPLASKNLLKKDLLCPNNNKI